MLSFKYPPRLEHTMSDSSRSSGPWYSYKVATRSATTVPQTPPSDPSTVICSPVAENVVKHASRDDFPHDSSTLAMGGEDLYSTRRVEGVGGGGRGAKRQGQGLRGAERGAGREV